MNFQLQDKRIQSVSGKRYEPNIYKQYYIVVGHVYKSNRNELSLNSDFYYTKRNALSSTEHLKITVFSLLLFRIKSK